MQQDFGWLCGLKEPRHLSDRELKLIHSEHEAIKFMINHGEFNGYQKDLAKTLDISPSHFSMMIHGSRGWPMKNDQFIDRIQYLTGLYAFDDFRQQRTKAISEFRNAAPSEMDELKQRIKELESRIA